MRHSDDLAFPEQDGPEHIAVQEEGGAEAMVFRSGGGKDSNLKGVQRLSVPP